MERNPLDVFGGRSAGRVLAPRPRRLRAMSRTTALTTFLALAVTVGGCSSAPGGSTTAATSPSSSTSTTAASSPSADGATPAASESAAGPTPTPVPTDVPKIQRPGVTGAPTVSAKAEPFTAPVVYGDGVSLKITKVTKGAETGQGPGVFAGREFAVFDVELTNGSAAAIELNQVAVTVAYGNGNLSAAPVYANDSKAVDFGGTVAPGASAKARYAFAVPAAELGKVTMVVDFDGVHTSAVFTGGVTA